MERQFLATLGAMPVSAGDLNAVARWEDGLVAAALEGFAADLNNRGGVLPEPAVTPAQVGKKAPKAT